jgi:hypothetical protein
VCYSSRGDCEAGSRHHPAQWSEPCEIPPAQQQRRRSIGDELSSRERDTPYRLHLTYAHGAVAKNAARVVSGPSSETSGAPPPPTRVKCTPSDSSGGSRLAATDGSAPWVERERERCLFGMQIGAGGSSGPGTQRERERERERERVRRPSTELQPERKSRSCPSRTLISGPRRF